MKKIIKSRIFIVIITMLICISGTLSATTKYQASEVLYNASNGETMNVNDALNDLYMDSLKIKEKVEYSIYLEFSKYKSITFNFKNNYLEEANCHLVLLNSTVVNGSFAPYVRIGAAPIIGNSFSFWLSNMAGMSGNGGGTIKEEYGVVCIN